MACTDGSSRQTKLKGCDIQKAKKVKKRCKPHEKEEKENKPEKEKRDCEALESDDKKANCRAKQGESDSS